MANFILLGRTSLSLNVVKLGGMSDGRGFALPRLRGSAEAGAFMSRASGMIWTAAAPAPMPPWCLAVDKQVMGAYLGG